jgi:hypothetical protein
MEIMENEHKWGKNVTRRPSLRNNEAFQNVFAHLKSLAICTKKSWNRLPRLVGSIDTEINTIPLPRDCKCRCPVRLLIC